MATLLVKGGTARGSFSTGLGVDRPSQNNRPMYPYLGYAHCADIRNGDTDPETIEPGQSRTVTMFRVDTVDLNMDGNPPIPGWPQWEMDINADTKLYPAVAIEFRVFGSAAVMVGNIFAVGVVL
jgi:hypothetical protein